MANPYKKPYVDSDVFIGWIKGEQILETAADGTTVIVERGKIAEHLLTLAEQYEYEGDSYGPLQPFTVRYGESASSNTPTDTPKVAAAIAYELQLGPSTTFSAPILSVSPLPHSN